MTKPSIVFIPGSYVLLSAYHSFLNAISDAGYEVKSIHLPTIGLSSREGRPGPAPSMYDDAAVIADEVEKLADQGKEVILVGHSYGGVPMSQSTKSLSRKERKAQGKSGGILRLGYMAALVPAVGQSARALLGRFPEQKRPEVSIDKDGWMLMSDPVGTAGMVCQDLPSEQGIAVVEAFAKHSAQSFGNELTFAGYKEIPSSYLLCEEDAAGPPSFQRDMIAMIEDASGREVDVTSIQSGHFPMLRAEKETVAWVLELAQKN